MKKLLIILLLMVTWMSLLTELQQITFDNSNDWDPDWSPDGNYFCFTSNRTGHHEIWKITIAGTDLEQLIFDDDFNMHPEFSPTDTYVAYDSEKSGNQDVWILPLDGGDHIQITDHPDRDESLSWNDPSPNLIIFNLVMCTRFVGLSCAMH